MTTAKGKCPACKGKRFRRVKTRRVKKRDVLCSACGGTGLFRPQQQIDYQGLETYDQYRKRTSER